MYFGEATKVETESFRRQTGKLRPNFLTAKTLISLAGTDEALTHSDLQLHVVYCLVTSITVKAFALTYVVCVLER